MNPAFDAGVFRKLTADVGSFAAALDFALLFLALLPKRIQRIGDAVKGTDRDAVMVALLSLQSSAVMLGAAQLEKLTAQALAHNSAGIKLSSSLEHTLECQAILFRRAFSQVHGTRTIP